MKSKPKTYVVSQMIKDYEKEVGKNNRLVFDYSTQRPEGQWSNVNQSLLIHSILQGLLVPSVYIVQYGADGFEPMSVLDGKQRMTIIYNYVTNGFKLSKTTPPVEITVPVLDENGSLVKDENGYTKTRVEIVEIKNKKFNQLPKEFQDEIVNFELSAVMIIEATKRELEEQMVRLNNGKTPTATQKAFMKGGVDVGDAIKTILLGNNFFTNRFTMTPAQERAGEDMKCAFHVLALLTNADFNKLTSGDLTKIAETMRQNWKDGNFSTRDIDYCNELLEDLNYWLPEEETFDSQKVLTTVHIPVMAMNVEKAKQMIEDEEMTAEDYKEFLEYWTTIGFYKDEYREYSEGSPSDRRNIESRIDFMEKELIEFINGKASLGNDSTTEKFIEDFKEIDSPYNSDKMALKALMQFTSYPIIDFTDSGVYNFRSWLKNNPPATDVLENCISSADLIAGSLKNIEHYLTENDIALLIHEVFTMEDFDSSVFEEWASSFEGICNDDGDNHTLLENLTVMVSSYTAFKNIKRIGA